MASGSSPGSGEAATIGLGDILVGGILAAVIGGVGSVLFVDRNPSFDIMEVFSTTWLALSPILSAFFIAIRDFRSGASTQSARPVALLLLLGILIGVSGGLLVWAGLWRSLAPLLLLLWALIGFARLRKIKGLNP